MHPSDYKGNSQNWSFFSYLGAVSTTDARTIHGQAARSSFCSWEKNNADSLGDHGLLVTPKADLYKKGQDRHCITKV